MTPTRDRIHFAGSLIDYAVVRSRRRKKTIEITLDTGHGVLVAAPMRASAEELRAIVRRKANWIIRTSSNGTHKPRPRQYVSGETAPYLGRRVRMTVEDDDIDHARVTFDHWTFRIDVPRGLTNGARKRAVSDALARWYKRRAAARLDECVRRWAPIVGCRTPRILTRSQRQRWGSCSADGTIRFNWRIVLLAPALMDYIVVHELAHMLVRDHSARYWAIVRRVLPDYRQRQARLRDCGPYLAFE
jgi:predicted metal-dependent hydrolase